jgi:hypothetical protein
MADFAGRYLKIPLVVVFDLVIGSSIAFIIGHLFKTPDTGGSLEELELRKWLEMALDTFVQALLTVFIGLELRSLIETVEDPTGALIFILSLFRQPSFWAKVDLLSLAVYNLIMGDIYPSLFHAY